MVRDYIFEFGDEIMALLSLGLLIVAIILGFTRKMNTGLLCMAFAMVVGRLAGMADKEIIAGFNYNLFIMLLGVTYLFSLAQINGCLDLLAKKVVALAGKRTYLIPVIIYLFATVLSAIGPGTVPTIAILMVFAMALAAELSINPAMLSALIVLGASGGGVSPLAATGIIGLNLCAGFGVTGIEKEFFFNGLLAATAYATFIYFVAGGYKMHSDKVMNLGDIPSFDTKQLITLAGIVVMVFLVMVLKINVGLVGFLIASILSFLKVSNETEALKKVPWGTLLLITGVGMLMNIITKLGGIKILSATLVSIMTEPTATSIMGLCAGFTSWFSSTSGVVMPTLIPTIPYINAQMNNVLNPVELATAITMISNTGGISPLSTGGALALAAYTSAAGSTPEDQQKLFMKMFSFSCMGIAFLCTMAYFGLFRWLL